MFRSIDIVRLIDKRKWKKLRSALKTKAGADQVISGCASGIPRSVLNVALTSKAPVDIIRTMLNIYPSISLISDEFGYLPVHIACACGASADIVELLVAHDNGASARALTKDGNSPLHCIVENICSKPCHVTPRKFYVSSKGSGGTGGSGDDVEMAPMSGNSALSLTQEALNSRLATIEYLCLVAPEMVRFLNTKGLTPIDVLQDIKAESTGALWERADIVYQGLRKVNIRLYRDQKKLYELSREKTGATCSSLPSLTASSNTSSSVSSSGFTAGTTSGHNRFTFF
jgi:hypothetical protein